MSSSEMSIAVEEDFDLPERHHWTLDLLIQLVKTKPLGAIGLLLVMGLVVVAIFAPLIAPFDPHMMHGEKIVLPPDSTFIFGTDPLARDFFSRVVFGARVSLQVGLIVICFSTTIYTLVGTLSAYFGGLFDTVVQRLVDTVMCIPWMVFMLGIMAILGPGKRNVIIALVVVGWAAPSRVIRGTVLAVKESDFVLAARATGCKQWVIIVFHVLPNVAAPIIIMATIGLGQIILAEAALSFLGFGIQPPDPSWGRMLSQDGLDYMMQAPGLAIFPGIAISIAVFGFNMLGDALRDLLDPRLKGAGTK
ncbi:MAG: ABC transporter permease [Proteobacteria bacterium]|nr:ABC transporter permease [Pseudomonadota bacterium]